MVSASKDNYLCTICFLSKPANAKIIWPALGRAGHVGLVGNLPRQTQPNWYPGMDLQALTCTWRSPLVFSQSFHNPVLFSQSKTRSKQLHVNTVLATILNNFPSTFLEITGVGIAAALASIENEMERISTSQHWSCMRQWQDTVALSITAALST